MLVLSTNAQNQTPAHTSFTNKNYITCLQGSLEPNFLAFLQDTHTEILRDAGLLGKLNS